MCPSVGRDDRGNTEPLNPTREEGRCTVGGGDAAERDGFWPACGAVDYREKIREARRLWKGSYNVDMNMLKPAAGYGDGCGSQVYVARHL